MFMGVFFCITLYPVPFFRQRFLQFRREIDRLPLDCQSNEDNRDRRHPVKSGAGKSEG